MIDCYLLIDFGSTYTKLTLVDIEREEIVATAKSITTVETNIMEGFEKAQNLLNEKIDKSNYQIVKRLACSSAAGGLKMVTIGLVPELTAEAGKRAALGAGARVLKTYSYELSLDEINEIKNNNIDIILLSGGTDGGNKEIITTNAKKIAEHLKDIPIIVAGNKCAYDEIRELFNQYNLNYVMTDNVMPKLNEINVLPVRDRIRELFMSNIIKSKGMDVAEDFIDGILMPTPAAVLKASECLANGTDELDGVGDLIVVDIGGATTDIHSVADGLPTKASINLRGLREPHSKRTVEGDLGMRYSALALFEASSTKEIKSYLDNQDVNILEECRKRREQINFVPQSDFDLQFDQALAKVATKLAMNRHAGHIEVMYTPLGETYSQYGKDLLEVNYLIGTGGVIIHSRQPEDILNEGKHSQNDLTILKPKNPDIYIDREYILSAMGLLSFDLPNQALQIMKKYILNNRGTYRETRK
ncbi:methylaspartate mutase accessory protein GlmL [Haloplasma contractile]|uniref:Methylaspartate mutase protein n=1 Tax=Haloplasma contractile SSD-17B TaxID=1033810 RepID=U2EG08_9MOLU|nr:methylaspartate mutase accessory protein GlmL [Haloplasma contractile]ERJ13853.1 methylaspartate mutase protein [Haloplasma contractile SSD-17B]